MGDIGIYTRKEAFLPPLYLKQCHPIKALVFITSQEGFEPPTNRVETGYS